jgi:hypothetical protein
MSSRENDIIKEILNSKPNIPAIEGVRSYDDDPFFVKKLEDAYKALTENPLPEEVLKRIKKD